MPVSNALDNAFEEGRADGRAALIPYLTAGYPEPDRFIDLAVAVFEAGADVVEIGIPFSDPLLDGPSIRRSQQVALDAGVTPETCFRLAAQIYARTRKPLLFMGAYNPILAYGVARFCVEAAGAGVSGFVVPDLPIEEQDELLRSAASNELHLIQTVAPTTTRERLNRLCGAASGFIYCISAVGLTGERDVLAETTRPLVESVRSCSAVPAAVGFGISGPGQAREVGAFADGVIVGSALINVVTKAERPLQAAAGFVADLRAALEGVGHSGV
jgi:tryptophan synthase alpha chain